MPVERNRAPALLLLAALPLTIGVFGTPARYTAPVAALMTLLPLLPMLGGGVALIRRAWLGGGAVRRRLAIAGALLVLPWAPLTLMPGYGPPFASTLSMNHTRFIILFVSSAVLGTGLLVLKDLLAEGEAGDRLLAPLGQAAALLGTMIQLVWAAILIGATAPMAQRPAGYLPLYQTPLGDASDALLFFAGLLTYGATALYALSFMRRGWLHPLAARIMAAVCAVAIVGLVSRGLAYPDLPERWYTAPGMIVGIPAIPWIMPYLLGVAALGRAATGMGTGENC